MPKDIVAWKRMQEVKNAQIMTLVTSSTFLRDQGVRH